MARKDGQLDVVELKFFSINLNAQHVNGMTHLILPYILENGYY